MIGLFKRCIARILRLVARLRVVFVSFGALAIAAMLLWTGFGVVFNYTHSAPFGLYREQFDSEAGDTRPSPLRFLLPRPALAIDAGRAKLPRSHAHMPRWILAPH